MMHHNERPPPEYQHQHYSGPPPAQQPGDNTFCAGCKRSGLNLLVCDDDSSGVKVKQRFCPTCMIGKKVRVFWPLDQKWYVGVVQEFNPNTGEHLLIYPDGDDEWVRIGDNQVVNEASSPVNQDLAQDDMFFRDKKREREPPANNYDRNYTMAKLRAAQQEHLTAAMSKNPIDQPPEFKRPPSPIERRIVDNRPEGHISPTQGYPPNEWQQGSPKSTPMPKLRAPDENPHNYPPSYGVHGPPPPHMHHMHHYHPNYPPPPMHYQYPPPRQAMNMEEKEDDSIAPPAGHPASGKRKSGPKTWTKEEDAILLNMVQNMRMPMKWSIVAQSMPERTGKQCRERYVNHLNPRLKNSEWSPQEDATIFHLYDSVGSQWAKMSKMIPGRTDNGIKNRFHNLRRQLEREDDHRLRLSKPFDFPDEIHLDRIRDNFPQELQGKNHGLWDMFKGIGIIAAQSVIGAGVARNQGKFGPFKVPDPDVGESCARCGLFVPSIQCGGEICERTKWCITCTRIPPHLSGNLLRECLNLRKSQDPAHAKVIDTWHKRWKGMLPEEDQIVQEETKEEVPSKPDADTEQPVDGKSPEPIYSAETKEPAGSIANQVEAQPEITESNEQDVLPPEKDLSETVDMDMSPENETTLPSIDANDQPVQESEQSAPILEA